MGRKKTKFAKSISFYLLEENIARIKQMVETQKRPRSLIIDDLIAKEWTQYAQTP